ncbi:hypothetical protein LIA77_02921 [Sarocladium implicatum]|nr:hypothetical protein LIA77_02921 [Sarocladium implicatum]
MLSGSSNATAHILGKGALALVCEQMGPRAEQDEEVSRPGHFAIPNLGCQTVSKTWTEQEDPSCARTPIHRDELDQSSSSYEMIYMHTILLKESGLMHPFSPTMCYGTPTT